MAKSINPLQKELAARHSELDAQRKLREDQLVKLNLDRIKNGMEQKSAEFATVMEMTKGKGQKRVMQIVQKEIIRAAEDALWCPDFSYRPHAEQDVNCFSGTHWMRIDGAVWKYFVQECAERCGVTDDLMMDADFKEKLVKNLAGNIFKPLMCHIPEDEVWLNMPNETLVIKTDGTVSSHPHQCADLFFYCLSYCYDKDAKCPVWHAFLDRVLPEAEAQQVLAEYFCYILMRSHRLERMLWLFGPGQNGKSTVLNVLEALLGASNISTISLSSLTKDQKVRLGIEHKMLNISSESGKDVDPDVLKQLVTGEKVTVERKYHDARQTSDYGKFIMATNNMPKAEDTYAFFRRMIIMPFEVVISDAEKDTHLIDKLKGELPGILNWVLAAFPGLVARNEFTESKLCKQAMAKYISQADSVSLFVTQMCQESEQPTFGSYLYAQYQNFCQFMKLDKKVGRNDFFSALAQYECPSAKPGKEARKFNLQMSE